MNKKRIETEKQGNVGLFISHGMYTDRQFLFPDDPLFYPLPEKKADLTGKKQEIQKTLASE
jgi:hypothetical protein